MPTRAEFEELMGKHAERQKKERAIQRQAQILVAEQVRTVVNHPGWQIFLDHLDAIQRPLQAQIDTLTRSMQDGETMGEKLMAVKMQLRDLKGELRGLDTAKSLIPTLIEAGDKALTAIG